MKPAERWNESQAPDARPGRYYVSARNDSGTYWLMRGPFAEHAPALDAVKETMNRAADLDARAFWYSWGTCRLPDDGEIKVGKMNAYFERVDDDGPAPDYRERVILAPDHSKGEA